MIGRRTIALVASALIALAAIAFVGRAERVRHDRAELRGMRAVVRAVGRLDSPTLDSYRAGLVPFDCLLYRRGANRYALELCIDEHGRLVEALDRRHGLRFWSLREEPQRSTIRFDHAEVERLLRKLGVPSGVNQGPRGQ